MQFSDALHHGRTSKALALLRKYEASYAAQTAGLLLRLARQAGRHPMLLGLNLLASLLVRDSCCARPTLCTTQPTKVLSFMIIIIIIITCLLVYTDCCSATVCLCTARVLSSCAATCTN